MKLPTYKQLFLIDGIGALVSALFLGLILVQLKTYIGMPVQILYLLALLALVFAIYSFSCHLASPKRWRFFLKLIALINSSYCLLTLVLVVRNYDSLTLLGLTYFVVEMLVILMLVKVEWRVASHRL